MINRLSGLAPIKDLKKYYIRDALGNLARFVNDKMDTMLSDEYMFDEGTKKLVEEYDLGNDDGWTFINIYLGRLYNKYNIKVNTDTREVIDKIISGFLPCINLDNNIDKQEKINNLQSIIKRYTKKVSIYDFMNYAEELLYYNNHENDSFMAHSIMATIICMILNEYDPYDICYINSDNKSIYYYCEIKRSILTCCDFREISVEQSVKMSNDMDYLRSSFSKKQIKKYGAPENYNAAFSRKMLNDINSLYGSKCFSMAQYVQYAYKHNNKNIDSIRNKYNSMSEDLDDMIMTASARYLDNIIRLLQFAYIDYNNKNIINDLEENRMKLFLDLNDDKLSNNPIFEFYYRYCSSRFNMYHIDITKRKRMFINGAKITFNPSNKLFKGIGFNYYICEYVYKNKLRIYIRVQNEYINRYFILSEGHNDYPLLCYNGYEFIALIFACAIIGIADLSDYLKDTNIDLYADITHNNRPGANIVDNNGNIATDSIICVIHNFLVLSNAVIDTLHEINDLFNNYSVPESGKDGKYRSSGINVSEMYIEEIQLNPFIRKLPIGQKASENAIGLAKRLKVELPEGYTIVEGHSREVKKRVK